MKGNRPINIAVIDDGINEKLYDSGYLHFNIEINRNLAISQREGYNAFLPSHGTTCAAIIKKYAPEIHISSIKILNDSSKRSEKYQFIAALKWCAENGIKLVNLSLGTIDFRDFEEIRDCVNRTTENGLIIIAACNNKNIYTVPSCLTNAIGVRCRKIYIDTQYRFIPYSFDGIDVEASGRHFLTDVFGNSRYTSSANSFAAPLVTAMVYKVLESNPDSTLEEIKKKLYKNALNFRDDGYNPYVCMNTDWFDKGFEFDAGSGCFFDNIRTPEQEGRKIWTAELYKIHLQEKITLKQIDVDTPVIAVYETENSEVFDKINLLFYKEGYYSVKISTDPTDVIGGSEYLPEDMQAGKFVELVYRKYCCDVILVRISGDKIFENIIMDNLFDIILDVDDIKCSHSYNNVHIDQSNVIAIDRNRTDEQIKDVFAGMLSLLGEA